MSLSMRCYQVTAFGEPVRENRCEVPTPTGTEVLIRITAAGVCHSDLHLCEGHFNLGGGRKLPFSGLKLPLTLGHEAAGTIVSAGQDAGNVEIGRRVVAFAWIGCGECEACTSGSEHLCPRGQSLGLNRPGAYAEYLLVPHPRYLVELGDLDDVASAPLGCSGLTTFSALRKFGPSIATSPIVIIGAGGLGLMALGLLKLIGGQGAVVIEIDPVKREAAITRGAIAAIDPNAPDAIKQVRKAVGKPIRHVLDLVGNGQTVGMGVDILNMDGKLVVVGLLGGDVNLAVPLLPLKSMTIQGSYLGSLEEFKELVDLFRTHRPEAMPIDRRPLSSVAAALHDLERGQVVGRVVLVP